MARKINKNFRLLVKTYVENKAKLFKDVFHVVLEGSSRSGKTISSVDFIIWYCLKNVGKTVFIIRETYASHKTTLYSDFSRRLTDFGLDNPFLNAKEVGMFRLNGNNIYFLGADKESKFMGAGCDLAYFNEILDIPNPIFDQTEQRVREMWFADYNPKATIHWVYDKICKRDDVSYLHSTYKDNPFISDTERKKVESYDPNNPKNIENGTADDYMHKVYARGERSARTGLCYPSVTWIDKMPDAGRFFYGMDFGFYHDPTAFVRLHISDNNLYMELLIYQPMPTVILLNDVLNGLKITGSDVIIADSADGGNARTYTDGYVKDLRSYGFQVIKSKKKAGYKADAIYSANRYHLHFVKNKFLTKEVESYCYQVINGIATNQPIDGNDHALDAMIYALQSVRPLMSVI